MTPKREALVEELRKLVDASSVAKTGYCRERIKQISKILHECKCRECGKIYDQMKSRADYTGYCSAKCLHKKARDLGYRKNGPNSEYSVLSKHDEVGNLFTTT